MKKNRVAYILVIILIFGVVVTYINLDKIRFVLSMMNSYKETKNSQVNVDNNSPTPKVVENPLLKIINEDEIVDNSTSNEDKVEESPIQSLDSEEEDKSPDNVKPNEDFSIENNKVNDTEKPTDTKVKDYKTIVTTYNEELASLQSEFEKELNNLIEAAINDYTSNNIPKTKLASKYITEGSKLEKSSDNKFYSLLKKMENELKANSHDISLIKDVAKYYENYKSEKKSSLISEGMEYVK